MQIFATMLATRERDLAMINHYISGWKRERGEATAAAAAVQRPIKKRKRSGQKKKKKKRRKDKRKSSKNADVGGVPVATGEATVAAAAAAAETGEATAAAAAAAETGEATVAAAAAAETGEATATTTKVDVGAEILQLAQPTPAATVPEMSLECEATPETALSLSQPDVGTTKANSIKEANTFGHRTSSTPVCS